MKNKFYLYCILCFLFNVAGYSQSTVFESLSFESNKLGRKVSYSIYLPSDYNTSKRNYPVLYLLHGYTDNETNWIQMGQMKTIADRAIANEEVPMIIVMPDAWDTWYINQYDGKVPYEDMFFEELIPYMEKTYRIRSDKESRAIAGLSMGGYGSFLYSLHHPDMFCACSVECRRFRRHSHGGKKKQIAQGFIQPPVRAGRRTLEAKQCLEDPFRLESKQLAQNSLLH